MPVGSTSIEEVERTKIVVIYLQQQIGFVFGHNLYTMDIDQKRNCYNCGGFGHLARNCRNWEIVRQRRKIDYKNNSNTINNLNRKESLVVLN